MSEFDTGVGDPADIPADVPAPAEPPSAPPPDNDAIIDRNRQVALGQLAKSENIEGYAQEREDQSAAIDDGEKLDEQRQAKWYRRASKALADAALEAQGVTFDEHGQPEAPPPPPEGYVPADQVGHMLAQERKTGAAAMRINHYFGDNQEARQNVTEWHSAMDPQGTVAQWLIDNESPMAGPIMQRTTEHPEALAELASLPPAERSRWLSKLEGHLEAEARFAQQSAQQQQQWAQQHERRVTKAPPIIQSPRGGAAPPQDLHQLASLGEDVSSYVKMRQQQERRRD